MLIKILLLFTILPIIELSLLIYIGTHNWKIAIFHVVFTGIIGAFLAKREGRKAWSDVKQAMAQGKIPGNEIVDAMLVLIAGTLLVTPGILTDTVGFLLLLPSARVSVRKRLIKYFSGKIQMKSATNINGQTVHSSREDDIIDVDGGTYNEELPSGKEDSD
ncbi:MAG: FxsA family protein [Lentisphaeria bacterium]|nr:FxsA family protein [Lentisphaeria bacterium]NQZ69673.1 FxsA family protein [Lentisphaeria bacterium]